MSQSANLLRLLEPTVRPVGPSDPGKAGPAGKAATAAGGVGQAPFEHQDFETLLASTRQNLADPGTQSAEAPSETPDPNQSAGPLDLLADIGRIENPGLREMIARHAHTTSAA